MQFGWIRQYQFLWQIFTSLKQSALRKTIALLGLSYLVLIATIQPAWAGLTDDNFDGEIFALYAGNGSIVPPKNGLQDSINQSKATVMVFYVDDSRDCKEFAIKISNLQGLYSRVANFIPVRVDSLPVKEAYKPTEPGYYYKGYVPQTVIFDPKGDVRFDESGQVAFEAMDDVMRAIFDLLPREESTALKRRAINEISGELAQ
jgi:hypothetical protein